MKYDVVIVGGGAAGSVLASRLAYRIAVRVPYVWAPARFISGHPSKEEIIVDRLEVAGVGSLHPIELVGTG